MKLDKAAIEENLPLVFVMGGLAILVIGCDLYVIYHYLKNLDGPAKLAIFGILFGTFVVAFCSWFSIMSPNTARRWTAFGCKVVLMAVMLICMASLVVLYMHNKAERLAKIEAERLAQVRANNESANLNNIADAAIRLKQETGSNVVANTFLKKLEPSKKPAITAPQPADGAGKSLTEIAEEEGLGMYEFLLEFSKKHIFYVPTITHFLAFVLMCFVLVATQGKKQGAPAEFPSEIEAKPTGPLGNQQRRY